MNNAYPHSRSSTTIILGLYHNRLHNIGIIGIIYMSITQQNDSQQKE